MKTQTAIGGSLVLVAFFLMLYNISDSVADLKNWHDASTPQFFAAIVKQVATVALSALGGTLMPGVGSNAPNTQTTTIEVTKTATPQVTP